MNYYLLWKLIVIVTLTMDPRLNPCNMFLTIRDLNRILQKVGIKYDFNPNDLKLVQQAFVHSSYANDVNRKNRESSVKDAASDMLSQRLDIMESDVKVPIQPVSYEIMEFVGDSMLSWVVAEFLTEKFPDENENFLTRTKISLIRKERLAEFSRWLGFKRFIIISAAQEELKYRDDDSILEDVFEAFVCSMRHTIGISKTRKFIRGVINSKVNMDELSTVDANYKDQIMRYYQHPKRGSVWNPSMFKTVSETGAHQKKIFKVVFMDNHKTILGEGFGKKKIDAQQMASKNALHNIALMNFVEERLNLDYYSSIQIFSGSGWNPTTLGDDMAQQFKIYHKKFMNMLNSLSGR